ncbi:MAG: division/cell wall cluster transcriptional repressor MraZ [Candidatus Dormibacteria bacterium]
MYFGEFRHSLDAKGRLAMPAKFRSQLPPGSVLTTGFDGCLVVAPPDQWNVLVEQMNNDPLGREEKRGLQVLLFSQAQEVEFDSQGRILLSARMREHAGIGDQAVVAGAGNQVHIWNPERFDGILARAKQNAQEGKEPLPVIG